MIKTYSVNGKDVLLDDFINLPLGTLQLHRSKRHIQYRPKGERKWMLLHHWVFPKRKGFDVDHINGNGLDNRTANLRYATRQQNMANAKMYRTNKVGLKGVSRSAAKTPRYYARIMVNGKTIQLGTYSSPEDAHKAYCIAAKKHFGEFHNKGD